ncbi:MAG: hypothetical protein HY788_11630 [Deltaproteobacteria bacterium]|nr:hypothetical protein [Deltaproteobacteria bacterium]
MRFLMRNRAAGRVSIALLLGLAAALLLGPALCHAQEEVASSIRRYKNYEASTGYYEEYEARPFSESPLIAIPGLRRGLLPYTPAAARIGIRSRLEDSHVGLRFYEYQTCEDCHPRETRDLHTVRANLTCRQCHGGEPISGGEYYYSPMNPIRRHAYVCSKCHEGANASFASYVVHSPNPASLSTRKDFPILFYAFWIMIGMSVSIFVVFLPHTFLWSLRELLLKRKPSDEGHQTDGEDQT